MINTSGDLLTDLYTQNIIAEHFPEFCFSDTLHIECRSAVVTSTTSVTANISINGKTYTCTEKYSDHMNNRLATTCAIGKAVIEFSKSKSRQIAPYGVLTGVRPFKITVDLLSRYDYDEVITRLKNTYLVSDDKIDLLLNTAMYDQKVRMSHSKNDVSVYISIPFCPTRCNYCSFISSAAPSKLELLDTYVDELMGEITSISELISKKHLDLKSIYIGGGTPTVLTANQLKKLLTHINQSLCGDSLLEFTVEAGRPDTINAEKLDIIKNAGVTRICVNCQSTDDNVLEAIGRKHTADDFFKAFELVEDYGFYTVNTDIIAGLDTDTFDSFKKTVDDVLSLRPDSITVHTLCIKKSAALRSNDNGALLKNIDDYIAYAKSSCIFEGFLPYYLYKQKYSIGNHENVGYCQSAHECHYNIAMMNEIENVFGLGAGATSKILGSQIDGKIEHFANFKYPTEYIGGFEKVRSNIIAMEALLSQN